MKKDDILSRFLEQSDTDLKYLRDIILSFVIAGKDTTAVTLSWFVYMLCKHQNIQEKVAEEVRKITKMEGVGKFSELAASLTEESLERLQYLHAALTETLRLYPAVPVRKFHCSHNLIVCSLPFYFSLLCYTLLAEVYVNFRGTFQLIIYQPS